MVTEGQYNSPFANHDLWRKSAFTLPEVPEQNLFYNADLELKDGVNDSRATILGDNLVPLDLDIHLPDLDSFQFGQIEAISPPETTAENTATAHATNTQGGEQRLEDDVWQLSLNVSTNSAKLRTWEAFLAKERGQEHEQDRVVYISEAGARVFDAALDRHARDGEAGDVLQSAFFLKCLGLLGEGRSSALFQWDDDKATFTQTLSLVRLSGFSLTAAQSVIKELGQVGARFVELRSFVDKTYAARNPLPARVALARCVQVIVEVLEQELAARVPDARSTLQLVGHFDIPGTVQKELLGFVRVSRSAKSDLEFIKAVQKLVRELAQSCSPYHDVHLDILDRVSRPWVRQVSTRVGLSHNNDGKPDTSLGDEDMEGLVSIEDSKRIKELSTGLVIVQDSCPDHPLLNSATWDVEQTDLDHIVVHVDAGRILDKAQKYEADLMTTIRQYNAGTRPSVRRDSQSATEVLGNEGMAWEDSTIQQEFFTSIGDQFARLPGQDLNSSRKLPGELRNIVTLAIKTSDPEHIVSGEDIPADLQGLDDDKSPLRSVQPLLQAQARLVNGTVLRLLFRQHRLRDHLNLQHSFHLFGNRVFVHRLSTALFSADSSSAERKKGEVIGGENLGLRLDSRSKWPPGGSELRLALMGILSDAYYSVSSEERHGQSGELLGGLSFSIRELEDAEIEKILDPHSIFALDFLRLSYEAPHPLDVVITERCLERYDEIFRCLLRLIRMIHVTTGMKMLATQGSEDDKNTRAFGYLAYQFVSSLAGYMFDVGIGTPWSKLAAILDTMEKDLATEDAEGAYGSHVHVGLEGLKNLHEGMLDSIRTRLLLRQKQSRLRDVLDNIYLRILDHWRRLQADRQRSPAVASKGEVDGLGEDIMRFLGLLRDMSRKVNRRAGHSKAAEEKEDLEAVDMLRVRLDLNGFYADSEVYAFA